MQKRNTASGIWLLTLTVVLCMILPVQVKAETVPEQDMFIPTSAWLVGPASPMQFVNSEDQGPCIVMNQYNNGYSMRISGIDDRIMAMAIDFRQDVFRKGVTYNITLAVSDSNFESGFEARAFDEGTLLINTSGNTDFFKALERGKALDLHIGRESFSFLLLGLGDGLERLKGCYKGYQEAVPQPETKQAVTEPESESILTPLPGEETPSVEPPQKLSGFKRPMTTTGKRLDNVLQKAAASIQEIEPAAGRQMNETVTVTKIEEKTPAVATKQWQSPMIPPEKKQDIVYNPRHSDVMPHEAIRKWRAMRGANMREVLEVWAQNANVRMIWMAGKDFAVKDSISLSGTFEAAVLSMLEQYQDEKTRPVGKLYDDPSTGKKALMIEMDRKL